MNSNSLLQPSSSACVFAGTAGRCVVGLLLVFTLAGCATAPRPAAGAPSLPGGLAAYGRVGLVMDNYPHGISFHREGKADTARVGFAEGVSEGVDWMNTAAEGTTALVYVGGYYGLLPYIGIRVASSTFGALGGLAHGAIAGVSPPQVQRAERSFHQARVAPTLNDGLEQRLLTEFVEQGAVSVKAARTRKTAHSDQGGLFAAMQREGFDTALEVTMLGAALRASSPANTQLSLRVPVYVRLVRLSDGRQLHSFTVEYRTPRSAARSLDVWSADDARLLHAHLARCSADLAAQIAARLLPAAPPATSIPLATTKE